MLRSRSARAVKKCGAITRKGAAFHTVFPDLSDCGRNSIRAQSATASRARRQSRPPDGRQKLRRANGPFTPAQKSPAAPTTASTRLRAAPCPASPKLSAPASKFNRDCCPLKPPQTPLQYSLDFFQIPVHFSKIKLRDTNSPGPPRRAPNDGMRRIAHARGAGLISGLSISAADKIKEPRAGSAVRRRGHQIVWFFPRQKNAGESAGNFCAKKAPPNVSEELLWRLWRRFCGGRFLLRERDVRIQRKRYPVLEPRTHDERPFARVHLQIVYVAPI